MDYAGIKIPEDIQGLSFRAVLSQNSNSWRDAIFYSYYEHPSEHHVNRHYGIRTNRYKLIHFYYDQDYWELYDLKKDPNELNNLYNQKRYKKVQTNLHKQLTELRSNYKDSDASNTAMIENFNSYKANKKKNKKILTIYYNKLKCVSGKFLSVSAACSAVISRCGSANIS